MEVCVLPKDVVPIRAMSGALLNSGILLVTGDANKSIYPTNISYHVYKYITYNKYGAIFTCKDVKL